MSRVRFVFHSVSRRSQPEEKLKAIWQIVAVITLQIVRHIVNRELTTETNIDPLPVRKIANVTNGVTGNGKDSIVIILVEHKFVTGFFHSLPPRINRVATSLQIRFREQRMCCTLSRVVILTPNE